MARRDERNRELLGRTLSKLRKSQPKVNPETELLHSELYIDQMVSGRKSINFTSIPPKQTGQTPTHSNLKGLLLDGQASPCAENLPMLNAVRGLDSSCRVDNRVSSSFLEPSRQWLRREKAGFDVRKKHMSPLPLVLTPESVLKQECDQVESRLQEAMESCEAFMESLVS